MSPPPPVAVPYCSLPGGGSSGSYNGAWSVVWPQRRWPLWCMSRAHALLARIGRQCACCAHSRAGASFCLRRVLSNPACVSLQELGLVPARSPCPVAAPPPEHATRQLSRSARTGQAQLATTAVGAARTHDVAWHGTAPPPTSRKSPMCAMPRCSARRALSTSRRGARSARSLGSSCCQPWPFIIS